MSEEEQEFFTSLCTMHPLILCHVVKPIDLSSQKENVLNLKDSKEITYI